METLIPVPETLQIIFAQIPLPELLKSTSRVCKDWNRLISDEKFLYFKKSYYKVLNKDEDVLKSLTEAIEEGLLRLGPERPQATPQMQQTSHMVQLQRCLPYLLQTFSSNEKIKLFKLQDCFSNIVHHPRFEMCQILIKERFPQYSDSSLAKTLLMICTSSDVHDCHSILKLLLTNVTPHEEINILETLYFLLTHLVIFRSKFCLPYRPIYILNHSLQMHYNQSVQPRSSEQSRTLTAEQRRIVNMDLKSMVGTTDTVRINAYAGTGKTTTLVELCQKNPEIKFLLVVFNKSVQEHSVKVFPRNVTVRTANSISWRYIMDTEGNDHFAHWNIKYSDLLQCDIIPKRKEGTYSPFNLYNWAAMVVDTMYNFCNSGDRSISGANVPRFWYVYNRKLRAREKQNVTEVQRDILVEDAQELWRYITRRINTRIKYDHTTCMKKFQLSNPDLQKWVGHHDVLLLDEAQDMNPCMLTICLNQKVPKVVVGDSFQQIYSFRGAINALNSVASSSLTSVRETFYLTQSFRFGPEIAFAADCCLKFLLDNKGPSLFGSEKLDSVVGELENVKKGPLAILARTNLGLFKEMVELVCKKPSHQRPKIAFAVDVSTQADPMGWEKLKHMSYHRSGKLHLIPGKTRYSPAFKKPWLTFCQDTQAANDQETLAKIAIVEEFGDSLVDYIEILNDQKKGSMDDPEVEYVFSTVHRFKGLEMDRVHLLDDFIYSQVPYLKFNPRMLEGNNKDEVNLLYVALTRAKKVLTMNPALFFLLTSNTVDECFEKLELSPDEEITCVWCKKTEPCQSPVSIYQKPVKIGTNKSRKSGYLCTKCACCPQRRIHHSVSEVGPTGSHTVGRGFVHDRYHAWFRSLLHPGQDVLDEKSLSAHQEMLQQTHGDPQFYQDYQAQEVDLWGDDDEADFPSDLSEGEFEEEEVVSDEDGEGDDAEDIFDSDSLDDEELLNAVVDGN